MLFYVTYIDYMANYCHTRRNLATWGNLMKKWDILLIDDDEGYRDTLSLVLSGEYNIELASSGPHGIETLEKQSFDLVLLDVLMPEMSGIETLKIIKSKWPDQPVMMASVMEDVDHAVEAIQLGACDFIVKGRNKDEITNRINSHLEKIQNFEKLVSISKSIGNKFPEDMVIGSSKESELLLNNLNTISEIEASCLILGETGTGKELAARYLHQNSKRRDKPFIIVNLPAVNPNLLESHLFGHVKGAFTGASQTQMGKFELADGGTIFLDEIADLSHEGQLKLLRVVETGNFEPVGSAKSHHVDVRIISATSQDLQTLIEQEKFKRDLYYRLAILPLNIPPLRERKEDIPLLANFFIEKFCKKYKKGFSSVSDEIFTVFSGLPWKGNIREFSHCIERMVIYSKGPTLNVPDIPMEYIIESRDTDGGSGLDEKLCKYEKQIIQSALIKNRLNQSATARQLMIHRKTLAFRISKLGIKLDKLREAI